MKKLKFVDASQNTIAQLGSTILHLTAVQELKLNSNMLTELPDEVGQLAALKHLEIKGNRLVGLCEALQKL